jgi:cytoskeleton protein RodZ
MSFDLDPIGRLLKERREERGITVDQVSDALYLRKSVVGALEAGNWDALPHPVYVKGYVGQYARLLAVCDEVAAELLKQRTGTLAGQSLTEISGGVPCST